MTADVHSVLLVSKDSKIISSITTMLMAPIFEVSVANDFNEARRTAKERN